MLLILKILYPFFVPASTFFWKESSFRFPALNISVTKVGTLIHLSKGKILNREVENNKKLTSLPKYCSNSLKLLPFIINNS